MQFVFCTQLFTEKHLLMMSWHWFCSNSCTVVFMTKKREKNTVNVLKIWTQCVLFLQNAYKCSCSKRTYVVEVIPEHVYKIMSKPPSSCIPSVPVVIPEVTETGSHRCWGVWYMSRLMTKPTKWMYAQPRLRSVWASARLIWVFAGRTCNFVGFVMRRLI